MADSRADRNLLLGILALQMDFVSRDGLIAAMNSWVLEKKRPLVQILRDAGTLRAEHQTLLEAMVAAHLEQHGNDAEKSLAAVNSIKSLREELQQIADPDVQASLAHVAADNAKEDPWRTNSFCDDQPTSSGMRFRILRPHAKGNLGEVLVAMDEELHREVALKQIQLYHADKKESRARFVLEAEVTSRLEHPGIVPVYGLGAYSDGRPYYAMRFIDGEEFDCAIARFHKLDDGPRKPGERALEFRKLLGQFIDVCNAIEYAHKNRILHRDLKPKNIMLGKFGETLVVDWGLAKYMDRPDLPTGTGDARLLPTAANGAKLTDMGVVVGTPAYMSPEQANGRLDQMGPASDVYSLGVTLYTLLVSEPAFRGADVFDTLRKVRDGEFLPPRKVKKQTPAALEAICLKAMALDSANRYPSARLLADDLEHWLADEPVTAHAERVSDRLFRFARRHRAVAVATIAAAVVIAAIACVATLLVNGQRRVAEDLARQNKEAYEHARAAREEAERATDVANSEREKASELAQTNANLAASERRARDAAVKSANEAIDERNKADKLAEERQGLLAQERLAREKADKLSEFLIGALQPEDPARFTGATFFAPKEDPRTFRVFDMLNSEASRASEELNQSPHVKAAVLDAIGDVYRQLAQFPKAEKLLSEALQIREKVLPADDPDLATSYFHNALYYHERGRFAQAKPLYLKALEIRQKLPNGKPQEADTLQCLGWLEFYEAPLNVAEKHFDAALKIREQLLNDAPAEQKKTLLRDVVYTKLGIAAAYAGQRKMLDAKRIAGAPQLREELIRLQEDEKLADALALFISAADDTAFRDQEKAASQFEKALALIQEAGKEKATLALVGAVRLELARSLVRLNRLPQAEKQYQTVIEIARRERMFQIPKQWDKISEYADVLRKLGKASDAQPLWREYLNAQEFRFGVEHPFYKEALAAYKKSFPATGAK